MDFGALPPEINSAKMYAGPGVGSMLVAAAAWEGIADELYSAGGSCDAILSALTSQAWLSESSLAMVTATAPYLTWLSATAAQAQCAAAQLRAAVGAFEMAFAATVPPPLVAANRSLSMLLTATNVLGVNTPAIATLETEYAEMWAQDAAAMYGYAGTSSAATTLTAFAPPAEVADPAALPALTSTVPQVLLQLASPVSAVASMMSSSMSAMSSLSSVAKALGSSTSVAAPIAREVSALGSALAGETGSTVSVVSADLGRAASLGPLSVPRSWASLAPAAAPVAAPSPNIVAPQLNRAGNMLSGLPIAGLPARDGQGASTATSRAGVRHTVMPRPEFGG